MMKNTASNIEERKDEHLRICKDLDVSYTTKTNGFEKINLEPSLFPQINPNSIKLQTTFLGKKIEAPLIIAAITGGTTKGREINQQIAAVCEEFQIAMGVGSQRIAIENKAVANTFEVREQAPTIPLLANLGIAQFVNGYGVKEFEKSVSMIQADGIAIHINPLQEFIQKEGDRSFTLSKEKIQTIIESTNTPIVIKGVGTGLTKADAEFLFTQQKIYAVDIAGAGGTNWSKIEKLRHSEFKDFSQDLLELGISTFQSLQYATKVNSSDKPKIIASGGIWNGVDAVKALLCGADYVAFALPALKALLNQGKDGLRKYIECYIEEMRITLSLLNKGDLKCLKKRKEEKNS